MHLAVFVLAFIVDVRVRAAEIVALPNSPEVLQEPVGCEMRASVCAMRTRSGEKHVLAVGETSVVLDANTSVVRLSGGELSLVSGTVWIRGSVPFVVRSEFGSVRSQGGEFWVTRDRERMTASATDQTLVLEPRGSTVALRIEIGEENWIGRVTGSGVAASGVPCAIPLADHLHRWARLFPGTRREFEAESRKFHASWSRGLASVASYHGELAEARRQALSEEAETKAQLRAKEEHRSKELRDMFRRKVLLD